MKPQLAPLPDAPVETPAGVITNLRHGGVKGSVSVLECLPGSTRSSHYHRSDSHDLFVVSGVMIYRERPVGSKDEGEAITVEAGQMISTGPMVEHLTFFPVRTILVSMSDKSRTHEEHEKDLVRVQWR